MRLQPQNRKVHGNSSRSFFIAFEKNLVLLVVLILFGPTTAACPLDDKNSLVDKSGILGRPGKAKRRMRSVNLKINYIGFLDFFL